MGFPIRAGRHRLILVMQLNSDAAIRLALEHLQLGRRAGRRRASAGKSWRWSRDTRTRCIFWGWLGKLGDVNGAIELIGKAIDSNPYVPEYHSNLSKFLCDQSRMPEAIAAARRAIQLQPRLAAAWNNLGQALRRIGKGLEAANAFVEAAELEPDFVEFQRLAGSELLDAERAETAVRYFRRLTQIVAGPAERRCLLRSGCSAGGQQTIRRSD